MGQAKTHWLLVGVLCLALWPPAAFSQDTAWEKYIEAAGKAYQQADYAEARKLLLAALKEAEKFGEQDPRLADTLNNLAGLYDTQGKYTEAEPLYQRALRIFEKVLPPEHPHVAVGLNNLGLLYYAQGKYAEAEPLYQRALAIQEKTLGPEHPGLAPDLGNLAELCRAQGRYAEAEPLYRRALVIVEKALGPEHLLVAVALENYADLLMETNREDEAVKALARTQAIRAKHAQENSKK